MLPLFLLLYYYFLPSFTCLLSSCLGMFSKMHMVDVDYKYGIAVEAAINTNGDENGNRRGAV
jgi:hypothetical protein